MVGLLAIDYGVKQAHVPVNMQTAHAVAFQRLDVVHVVAVFTRQMVECADCRRVVAVRSLLARVDEPETLLVPAGQALEEVARIPAAPLATDLHEAVPMFAWRRPFDEYEGLLAAALHWVV